MKEHYCPARNHTTLHDHVLLKRISTVHDSEVVTKGKKVVLNYQNSFNVTLNFANQQQKNQEIFVNSKLLRSGIKFIKVEDAERTLAIL